MVSDKAFSRAVGRIMDACRNLVSRGVVTRTDDAPRMQTVQLTLLEGELLEGAERFQPYGLTSRPQEGAEALCVFVGADRSHPVVLAVDDRRFRVTSLRPGEVCLYTDEGDTILFGRDHHISIRTLHLSADAEDVLVKATSKITVDAPETEFAGHVSTRAGLSNSGGPLESQGRNLDRHVHDGVEPGGGTTGGPV